MKIIDSGKIYQKNKLDYDYYQIEVSSQLSSKEYSIVVDFIDKKVEGTIVHFGSWENISKKECIELLKVVAKKGKLLRDYKRFI